MERYNTTNRLEASFIDRILIRSRLLFQHSWSFSRIPWLLRLHSVLLFFEGTGPQHFLAEYAARPGEDHEADRHIIVEAVGEV